MPPVLKNYSPPSAPYLDVLYEENSFLVLNKPSGLLSVPGKGDHLIDCLEWRVKQIYGAARAAHRLDMDTSGLILMALSNVALSNLSKQFEKRKVLKTYIATLFGNLKEDEGEINLPLICDWPHRPKQMVCHKRGKPSLSYFKVLKREDKTTTVEFKPKTGRSHQLRVHALAIGHPIIGDRFYAEGEALNMASRLNLHAQSLSFRHPRTGEKMTFEVGVEF